MRGSSNRLPFWKLISAGILLVSLFLATPAHARRNNAKLLAILLLLQDPTFQSLFYGQNSHAFDGPTGRRFQPAPLVNPASATLPQLPTTLDVAKDPIPMASAEVAAASDGGETTGVCASDPYAKICAQADANQATVNVQTQNLIRQVLQQSGVPIQSLQNELDASKTRFSLGPNMNRFYGFVNQWINARIPGLQDMINSTHSALTEGLQKGGATELMKSDVLKSKIIITPNPNDAGETARYNQVCDLGTVNALSAVDRRDPVAFREVYICWPRVIAALVRGNGNSELALADLSHTVMHERGHKSGGEIGSPHVLSLTPEVSCLNTRYGETNRFADRIQEYNADTVGAEGLAAMIEKGQTFGLSKQEFAVRAMQRLCGDQTTEDHPSSRNRLILFRQNPRVAAALGCSQVRGACTQRGTEPVGTFGRAAEKTRF